MALQEACPQVEHGNYTQPLPCQALLTIYDSLPTHSQFHKRLHGFARAQPWRSFSLSTVCNSLLISFNTLECRGRSLVYITTVSNPFLISLITLEFRSQAPCVSFEHPKLADTELYYRLSMVRGRLLLTQYQYVLRS